MPTLFPSYYIAKEDSTCEAYFSSSQNLIKWVAFNFSLVIRSKTVLERSTCN